MAILTSMVELTDFSLLLMSDHNRKRDARENVFPYVIGCDFGYVNGGMVSSSSQSLYFLFLLDGEIK